MLFLQVSGLSHTDTVLSCAGAAALQGVVDDLGVDRLGPLLVCLIFRIDGEDGVVVPVPDMAKDGPFEAAGRDGVAGVPQGPRKVGDRDAHIRTHHPHPWVEVADGEGRVVAGLPELLAALLIGLELERSAPFRRGGFTGHFDVALHAGSRAAELEEEGGGCGVVGALVGVYGTYRARVDKLDATDPHTGPDHGYS